MILPMLWYRVTSAFVTVAAFLFGALCSGAAGYVGMWVSVRANVRVSSAARRSAREALQVLFITLHNNVRQEQH